MTEHIRPIAGDDSADQVMAMLDLSDDTDWLMSSTGDYQAAAVETMVKDGSGYQRLVALEWPARRNHTDDHVTVRLMISPDDAVGLALVLAHTADWLLHTEGSP